jgi:cell wall-associated NlpC family hydrolase
MTDATNGGVWAVSKLLIAVVAVMAGIAGPTLLSGVVSAAAAPHSAPRPAMSQEDAILAAAASQAGTPYCGSGGGINGPSNGGGCSAPGFNCMSFAQYAVYQGTGDMVPSGGGQPFPNDGEQFITNETNLLPGDAVFFGSGTDVTQYAHSGIYAGHGMVWDTRYTGDVVALHSIAQGGNGEGYPLIAGVRFWKAALTTPTGPTIISNYDLVGSDGGVFAFGGAFHGSLPALGIHVGDVTGIVPSATKTGYYLVGSDGGVFAFNAPYVNSLPGVGVHVSDIVGIVPTSTGTGYFVVGRDGGVFSFNAPFEGSLPGIGVHVSDIVGIAATADDKGYLLVGADGSVYAFGDAHWSGNAPAGAAAITSTADGRGYWVVGSDGLVTSVGDAGSFGDLPTLGVPVSDIVGIVPSKDGRGYLLIGRDGGVFGFGDAGFTGSLPGLGVHVSDIVGAVPA